MAMKASLTVGLLLLVLSVLAASVVSARRIDCTRFVFAPRCRGVAAKRGEHSLSVEDTNDLEDTFSESLLPSDASREEDSEKFLRLLLDLSRALGQSVPPSPRGRELLDRLLRS